MSFAFIFTVAVLAFFVLRYKGRLRKMESDLGLSDHNLRVAQKEIALMQRGQRADRRYSELALLAREIQDQGHEFSPEVLAKIHEIIGVFRVTVTIRDRTIFDSGIYPPGMDAKLLLKADFGSTHVYVEKIPAFNKRLVALYSLAVAINSWAEKTYLSMTDGLTGLYNRSYWEKELEKEQIRADRYGHKLSVVMVDLDHFKNINDTYGHVAGDRVLEEISALFLREIRKQVDKVARYGGEEFVFSLTETNRAAAEKMAEKIRRAVESHRFSVNGSRIKVTVSVGVTTIHPNSKLTVKEIEEKADGALYLSKENGRNRVTVAP